MANRNAELDIAKGLLIILVVFGHVLLFTGAYPDLLKIIYSFHMFSFLCISGILWNKEKYKNFSFRFFWENKIRKILVCYFLFEIIAVLIRCFFSWGEFENINATIVNILVGNCYLGADWYLYTYFFSSIVLFFLFRTDKPFRYFVILVLIEFLLIYFIKSNNSSLMIIISRILLFTIIVFFSNTFKNELLKDISLSEFIVLLIVFIASALINRTVFIHASILGNPILFFLSGLSGLILVLNISKRIHSHFLAKCGEKSIILMGTHQNVEYLIAYFYGMSKSFPFVIGSFLIMLIVSFILCVPVQFLYSSICTGLMKLKRRL